MIPQFISWNISRFCSQLVTRADFGLFPPVLNPLALPEFKTSLSVCTSLCALKPEDEKKRCGLGVIDMDHKLRQFEFPSQLC